jgi:hypothetical protein
MNAITLYLKKAALRSALLAAAAMGIAYGQTLINLGSQGRNIDFTGASFTRPVKTGTSLPATCSSGDLFFNTSAPAGQNLYGCPAPNTWAPLGSAPGLADPGANGIVQRTAANTTTVVAAPSGAIVGTNDAQTLSNKSIDASEINSGILSSAQMPGLSGDVSTPAGSSTATLATVNSTVGSFGDGANSVRVTVDAKGRVTSIAQVPITAPQVTTGTLASLSASCTAGNLYLATDQPAGQQIYACSSANTWTQNESVGTSGALAVTNGSLDILPSVVPRLMAANTFTGLNTFVSGIQLQSSTAQPSCASAVRGLFWFQNNGSSKDAVQVCVYNGSSFAWISLY